MSIKLHRKPFHLKLHYFAFNKAMIYDAWPNITWFYIAFYSLLLGLTHEFLIGSKVQKL